MGVGETAGCARLRAKVTPTATLLAPFLEGDRLGRGKSGAGRITPRRAPHNTRRVIEGLTNSDTAARHGSTDWRHDVQEGGAT